MENKEREEAAKELAERAALTVELWEANLIDMFACPLAEVDKQP